MGEPVQGWVSVYPAYEGDSGIGVPEFRILSSCPSHGNRHLSIFCSFCLFVGLFVCLGREACFVFVSQSSRF